jgi:putative membrane protein
MKLHPLSILTGIVPMFRQFFVVVILVAINAESGNALASAAAGIGAGGVAAVIFSLLRYLTTTYTVSPHEVILDTGWIWRRRRVIPRDRVQEVVITQNLSHRLFGVCEVRIETAGSRAEAEAKLDALGLAEAHALRNELVSGASTALDIRVEENVVYTLSLKRIVWSSMLENRALFFLAIIASFGQQFMDSDRFMRRVTESAVQASRSISIQAAVTGALVFLFAGWVMSVVLGIWQFYGFKIVQHERGLHIRHGLVNIVSRVVSPKRAQLLTVRQGLLFRYFELYALSVATAGVGKAEGMASGHGYLSPAATASEVDGLCDLIMPGVRWHSDQDRGLNSRASWLSVISIVCFLWLPFSLIAGLAAYRMGWFVRVEAAVSLVSLVVVVASLRAMRTLRFGLRDGYFRIAQGALFRRKTAAPASRLQGITVSDGPLERLFGLCSVTMHCPGSAMPVPHLEHGPAQTVREELLADRRRHRGRGV